jgi:hypothetical protein
VRLIIELKVSFTTRGCEQKIREILMPRFFVKGAASSVGPSTIKEFTLSSSDLVISDDPYAFAARSRANAIEAGLPHENFSYCSAGPGSAKPSQSRVFDKVGIELLEFLRSRLSR